MRWNRGLASWLLSLLILSGIAALFFLPVLLTATILPNSGAVRLPELPPPLDPVVDALEVQKLLETTYLGRGKEVPDPGEPAIVLRKYLEQNTHGYHHLLARDELKLDIELATWQGLVQLYPQSRHALVALAKYYGTKVQVSGNRSYLRQAADAYLKAAEIGLAHGRIGYTRELADLLVRLGDKAEMDAMFGRMLAQPREVDHDNYYLALVDYADGLARLGDDRAWDYFEQAIDFHPENNLEAINLYARYLIDHGHAQKAIEVLDTRLTLEQRVRFKVPAWLRQEAMKRAGFATTSVDIEIDLIKQQLGQGPLFGGDFVEAGSSKAPPVALPTPLPDFSLNTLFTPATAEAQVAENPISTVFTINPTNNAIWKAQLYADNATSAFVFFDAGPAKKLAALRWPKSKRAALIRIDTNNVVWYRHFNGTDWGAWQNFGQTALDVAAAAWPPTSAFPNGQADIFIVHTDGILRQRRSTNGGENWGSWTVHTPCCTVSEVAVAVAPVNTSTNMLFLAARPTGLDQAINVVTSSNGTTWPATGWTNLGQPLGGPATDLTLLAYNNTMALVAVGADQCSLNQRHWNGGIQSNWAPWVQYGTSPCTRQVSSFTTQEGNDLDKSAFLLYVRANGVLVTHRFNGTLWENGVQQGVMPWLAATGANFQDDGDPPYEHDISFDDCRIHDATPVYTVYHSSGSIQHYFAHAVNLAEIMYNEARSETIGAIDMVGWTVRDRAFQGMKTKRESNNNTIACDSYVGGVNYHNPNGLCASLPCNEPQFCTNNGTRWYCCAMHGAMPFGTSHHQFNDGHVSFSALYYGGFLDEAVVLMSNFIPESSSRYVPQGAFSCDFSCGTKIDDPNAFGPGCFRDAVPPLDAFFKAAPEGPMEYLAYDYCARTDPNSSIPLLSCKRYTADYCGNTPPVQLNPGSICGQRTRKESEGDNFFWSRVKP